MDFKIKSIVGTIHDTGFGGYPYKVIVMIECSSKDVAKLKKDLGPLVLDVNNAVYKFNPNIPAHYPSIDSQGSRRAKKGIKTMEFVYFFKDHLRAESLGFELFKFKSGEIAPKYGQHINLMKEIEP